MINKRYFIVLVVLMLFSIWALADPIKDSSLDGHKAGWYPNNYKNKLLTCPETCKVHVRGLAEYEASPGVPKRAFVCKAQTESEGNIDTWLYGNQFDDRKACYTVDISLKGKYTDKYFCLCVRR